MALSLRRSATAARGKKPDSIQCKRHPKHQQSPGVCSLCLREKLSQISIGAAASSSSSSSSFSSGVQVRGGGGRYSTCSTSSSLSPECSSTTSGSSMASPVHRYRFDDRLGKSRSIAFVPSRRGRRIGNNEGKGLGFWSRLMPKSRNSLKHSNTTVRER